MVSDADQYAPLDSKHQANASTSSRKVAYYYDQDVGNYTYGLGHPMKPHRIRMTHNLVLNYDLMSSMEIFRPIRATPSQLTKFHSDDYVDFLQSVTPETAQELTNNGTRCLVGEDCPAFEGLFEFCSISAGGSIGAAERLNSGQADIAINWAGGLHHAKKTEASGFCYINDINLGILELLRIHPRVLYVDVDVHHGDGVEEAFYSTDRVMTCSFHRFGDFFPGTGDVKDAGIGRGKGYAVNVPLRDGITDESFQSIFKPVIQHIMDFYRPGAVVLQCGADSLAGDKLGCFNLSLEGHAECARFVKSFNLPTMMLGGGGYTTKNVARAWTYETAVMCDVKLDENLPYNQYLEYYGPKYKLEVLQNNMDNQNTPQYLENIKVQVLENLRNLPHAPGVQIRNVPGKSIGRAIGVTRFGNEDEPETDADRRLAGVLRDRQASRYDDAVSDDEGPNGMDVDSDEEIFANGRTTGRGRRPGGQEGSEKRLGMGEKLTGAARRAAKALALERANGIVPPVVRQPEPSTSGSNAETEGPRKKRSFFGGKSAFPLVSPAVPEPAANGPLEDWTVSGGRSRANSPMSVV